MALPLPSLTRHLNDLASASGFGAAALREELRRLHPRLLAQIEDDAAHPHRFADWGMSSNLDRGARAELVHPRLLEALCQLSCLPLPSGNTATPACSTLMATSLQLPDPFGFKRERWTRPDLERGLALRPGLITARPVEGTLLENVTALMQAIWNPQENPTALCGRHSLRRI